MFSISVMATETSHKIQLHEDKSTKQANSTGIDQVGAF
jgi:hypothetical protein